jgi:hypothetical protein
MAARRTTVTTTRESRVRSRQGEDKTVVAATPGGMGFADAVVIGTTILLVVAFVMMDKYLGMHFGKGLFFAT